MSLSRSAFVARPLLQPRLARRGDAPGLAGAPAITARITVLIDYTVRAVRKARAKKIKLTIRIAKTILKRPGGRRNMPRTTNTKATAFTIKGVDRDLANRFRAACHIRDKLYRDVLLELMEQYARKNLLLDRKRGYAA
jgi:hypothetical protein